MNAVPKRRAVRRIGCACRWLGIAGCTASVGLWLFTLFGWCGVTIDDDFWSNSYQVGLGAIFRANNNRPKPGEYGLRGFHLSKRVSVWWQAGGPMVSRPIGRRLADFRWWPENIDYFLLAPGSSFYTPEPWALIPLWGPLAASAGAWMIGQKLAPGAHRQGRCQSCGYERSGLPADAPCPECGKPVPPSRA